MKAAQDFIPWKVTDISIRPYDGYWSMNPSLHFDGELWRCVLRCCDYAMPSGKTIRSSKAGPGHQSKNAMVIFDPQTWKPIQIFKMHERDDHPRVPCANVGYEDMRIFKTDRGGLQGIAASLHLKRDRISQTEGSVQNQPPEQVLLSFDGEYNIIKAKPIRGDRWSGPEKNWVPFTDCAEPRFLYSIDKGTMFDDRGAIHGDEAAARPSPSRPIQARRVIDTDQVAREREQNEREQCAQGEQHEREQRERAQREQHAREQREQHEREQREQHAREQRDKERDRKSRHEARPHVAIRGGEVQRVRGRFAVDALSTRPASRRSESRDVSRSGARSGLNQDQSRQTVATGRALPVKYGGLRGGSQLVHVGDGTWLGIGHEMRFDKGLKFYWHNFYLVDSKGKMKAASPPCKLASEGIEFAAGMAIDGERVVVSFGVDDMQCRIGETKLSAVLEILKPTEK
jgi:hypothetical protein